MNNYLTHLFTTSPRASACRRAIVLGFTLSLLSCEDLSNKVVLSQQTGLVVVDGNITSEIKNHLITLTFPYETQNGTGAPVTGAVLSLTVDTASYSLTEFPAGSGLYYTPVLGAVTNKIYTLTISWQGNTFSAQDSPQAVEALDPLSVQKTNSLYSLNSNPSGSQPNFIRHSISWQNTSYCTAGTNCLGDVYFYDLKSSDVNDIFKPSQEVFYFPSGSTVIRTKYSVSPAYRSFLRSMLSETEWSGGVFDVQHAPVGTNLSNGAIGFFAVSTVVSDTTVIQ